MESLRSIFNKYNMPFAILENPSIQKHLKKDERHFRATKDYCDCDTYLGMLDTSKEYKKLLGSSKVRKLRKKRWIDTQIDGWIKSKLGRVNPKFKRLIEAEKRSKYRRWIDFLSNLMVIKSIKSIGILKHWHSINLENEDIEIVERRSVKIAEINEDLL